MDQNKKLKMSLYDTVVENTNKFNEKFKFKEYLDNNITKRSNEGYSSFKFTSRDFPNKERYIHDYKKRCEIVAMYENQGFRVLHAIVKDGSGNYVLHFHWGEIEPNKYWERKSSGLV